MTKRKILLPTIGSLGDLHPFIALGLALQARDIDPLLAVPASHVDKVRSTGLDAVAIMPPFDQVGAMLGLSEAAAVGRVMSDQDFMIRQIVLRLLRESARALDVAADDAVAIVGSIFALAGPIIAEKRGIPFIPTILQPMAIFSAYDPPMHQGFATIPAPYFGALGRAWNRLSLGVVRGETRRRYAKAIDRVRRDHGLGPMKVMPILDPESDRPLRLGLYSPVIAPVQPDFPRNVKLVGFPLYDRTSGIVETLDPEFEAFMADGPAPLVFTLGTFATYAPGDFYRESRDVAQAMGMRAVLLTGDDSLTSGDDVLVRNYAPHSLIFPRAAAIIHHGGIGTTGQALLAGKPQLVVPHMGDQRDNGARVARLGVARVLAAKDYSADRARAMLTALLADQRVAARAAAIAIEVGREDAANVAADAIIAVL